MAVAGRWRDPAAFRPDPVAVQAERPSRRQSVALIAVLALVAGAIAAVSVLVKPDHARSFDLFHGSLFLGDAIAPVAIDLASGLPTIRLAEANAQVGAANAAGLSVVPLADGTLLLNRVTGEFNMVDATGFLVKTNGGVQLPRRVGTTGALGVPSANGAYVVQTGSTGTSVYLVGTSTVQSAFDPKARVQPRASRTMTDAAGTEPGTAATAGDDLWLLVGSGSSRTIRHLTLPTDSSPGVTLGQRDYGSVDGPAALSAASGGTGQTVGVASAARIMVFRGNAQIATARWTAPDGVDTILAATNNTKRLSFLLHAANGWSVVSTDAHGGDLRGPTLLVAVRPTAQLVAPAASNGDLYTMDTGAEGDLIRIDGNGRADALPGARVYPQAQRDGHTIERAAFTDAYVVARGARVVYNSPNHLRGLVVFTDATHDPVDIEKSSAVTVNAAGGAAALTRSRQDNQNSKAPPAKSGTTPKVADPVNNRIDCNSTAQKPHIPLLGQPFPGSRSVLLSWTYPTTSQQDCVPSTFVLDVSLLSTGAPSPPSAVTVQGQRSVNLTGLFPSKRYKIAVTAYINGRGTASDPIYVTTGPEGPAAPHDVAVRADAAGNWNIGWSSCGSVKAGCVPSESWKVIPQFCDGRGLSGAPAEMDVAADPTAVKQPGTRLVGGDALLGRGVRFTIEGVSASGAIGKPSASTSCVTSWSPSTRGGTSLAASRPAATSLGGSTSTTVTLNLGADAVHHVGGVGGQIQLALTGAGATQTSVQSFDGRKSIYTAQFDIRPGAAYTASATVSPPGHPGNGVGLGPIAVSTRSNWPALSVTGAACPSNGLLSLTCDLSFSIAGVTSGDAAGETFDLTDKSFLRCGNAGQPLVRNNFDPATGPITVKGVLQTAKLFGACTITVELIEHSPHQPSYFGGAVSGTASAPVDLGKATTTGAGSGDFSATWNGGSAQVTYTGGNPLLTTLTNSWNETIKGPDGSTCSPIVTDPPTQAVPVDQSCVNRLGQQNSGWTVAISYDDTLGGAHHTATATIAGAPPTYQPCNPGSISASWGGVKADGVSVIASGSANDLSGCSNWTFQLLDPTGTDCTGAIDGTSPPANIQLSCGTPPSQGDWTVVVKWKKTNGDPDSANPVPIVTGAPPTA